MQAVNEMKRHTASAVNGRNRSYWNPSFSNLTAPTAKLSSTENAHNSEFQSLAEPGDQLISSAVRRLRQCSQAFFSYPTHPPATPIVKKETKINNILRPIYESCAILLTYRIDEKSWYLTL